MFCFFTLTSILLNKGDSVLQKKKVSRLFVEIKTLLYTPKEMAQLK